MRKVDIFILTVIPQELAAVKTALVISGNQTGSTTITEGDLYSCSPSEERVNERSH
ncbi:MAG: hypothetical protein F6K21_24195 [Symploca sp. SIO2D2]|nr:hypothetical protein [Symploca sp. SIO2D2]